MPRIIHSNPPIPTTEPEMEGYIGRVVKDIDSDNIETVRRAARSLHNLYRVTDGNLKTMEKVLKGMTDTLGDLGAVIKSLKK